MPPRLLLAVRLVVAVVLLQTLFFKFTGAAESVAIFSKVGMEPWGRIGSGVVEGVAAALLLRRSARLVAIGAALALSVIVGAIGSHLFVLGIEVEGDGGLLFALALVVFVGSAVTLVAHRAEVAALLCLLRERRTGSSCAALPAAESTRPDA